MQQQLSPAGRVVCNIRASNRRSGHGKNGKYMRDKVIPAMDGLRDFGDAIELLTPHELWPLPTYREMLFLK